MTDKLLTISEVAIIIQVGAETVRRHLRSGKLRGVKVGGQWRVRESELSKFVGNGKEVGHDEDV